MAHEALLREVHLTPKPGLVDRRNTGSHRDMTLATFEVSADALRPFFEAFVEAGMGSGASPPADALPELRRIGLACESAMLVATAGVNTHKGAIFSFGLLLGAAGRLIAGGQPPTPERITEEAALIAAGLVQRDLAVRRRTARTAGEYIFRRYGLTGARGEAESGFASVRSVGLPAYRAAQEHGAPRELALLAALIDLLAVNGDTNLVARGGMDGLRFVRREAVRLREAGGIFAPDALERLEAMDDALIARNLSPGGTADLVGVTWFLAELPVYAAGCDRHGGQ
ncbi:triphosphoribosyl-dephospho-CoA synthase CitG [Tropicimonas isoalkanivorans]|uniref:Probable 2-(5''-triphosphoribosyl)-3'-dephosphocoenzyme-A synthase n=1 Tax=Tropicimonas isoalkanivorans TaxID=441112 RepID=A0A1I1DTQ4_9RHOB|nr:triphosphoribosyl-dephospho-CoA synthase CitG [Tropicimonas isoalkanivorans]SFB78177.1 triphosphoribosyl-dephospho-CoA synthase [Tropicimonas isoalkanivorans]